MMSKERYSITENDRMTLEEISKILHISVNTLQRRAWRIKTGCPVKKIGGNLVAYRRQFSEWLEKYDG